MQTVKTEGEKPIFRKESFPQATVPSETVLTREFCRAALGLEAARPSEALKWPLGGADSLCPQSKREGGWGSKIFPPSTKCASCTANRNKQQTMRGGALHFPNSRNK